MIWKKLGKIFDPTEHTLPNNCVEFAQSPQALTFDNFVRIYFSTREKDLKNGKFLSHISYVDMDENLKVLRVAKKPVIELGSLGSFDEHGIFPINPVRADNKILAYTCGWSRRVSVSVETSTGLAISNDNGETFQRIGSGPVLSSSLKEPFLVGDSFVSKYGDLFHMWYIFGTSWSMEADDELPARVYKIGYCTSTDGINWKRDSKQIISDKIGDTECQALPTVIKLGSRYHMYFCYRYATGFRKVSERGYRLGYAYSDDLVNWIRDDSKSGIDVTKNDWDSDMQCYPHIFNFKGKTYLLYNGNEFGRFGFGAAVLESEV